MRKKKCLPHLLKATETFADFLPIKLNYNANIQKRRFVVPALSTISPKKLVSTLQTRINAYSSTHHRSQVFF